MFKNLKKKLETSAGQVGLNLSGSVTPEAKAKPGASTVGAGFNSRSEPKPVIPRDEARSDLIDFDNGASQAPSPGAPHGPSPGPFTSTPLQTPVKGAAALLEVEAVPSSPDAVFTTPNSPGGDFGNFSIAEPRSRVSSFSSVTSESTAYQSFTPSCVAPSDVESEYDDAPNTAVDAMTRDELIFRLTKTGKRLFKYKSKFGELLVSYKDMERDRDKLKSVLTSSQDKSLRRISELKEQCHLDQLAKQDLEENYRLMLDERDELVRVLQTQVKLLKEGKEIPEDLIEKNLTELKAEPADEKERIYKEKIKRLEGLLGKCKDTIQTNKEKFSQVIAEKDKLRKDLDEMSAELDKAKVPGDNQQKLLDELAAARILLDEVRTNKDLEIASFKCSMHATLENKDTELTSLRDKLQTITEENSGLQEKISKMEEKAKEQLEKSRDIIRKLQEDKKRLGVEAREKIENAERSFDEERQSFIADISRGKAEAIRLLQEEEEKRIAQLRTDHDVNLNLRDDEWKAKMADQEQLHVQAMANKNKEWEQTMCLRQQDYQRLVEERDEEMRLAIEERELQKMAALSHQDTKNDVIQRDLDDIKSKYSQMEILQKNVKEEHMRQVQQYVVQIEKLEREQAEKIARNNQKCSDKIAKIREEIARKHATELDNLAQDHQQQREELSRRHEDALNDSNRDMTSYYTEQIQMMTQKHETAIAEKVAQIEHYNKISENAKLKLTDSEADFESKTQTLQEKIDNLEASLKSEHEICDQLIKEKETIQLQFETDLSNYQSTIQNLQQGLLQAENNLTELKREKDELEEIYEKTTEEFTVATETLENERSSMEKEREEFNRNSEAKDAEFANLKHHLEEKIRLIEEQHRHELERNLESMELQRRSSLDEVATSLGEKLNDANQLISSLEKTVQSLTFTKSELEHQLETSKKDFEHRSGTLENSKAELEAKLEESRGRLSELSGEIKDLKKRHSEEISKIRDEFNEKNVEMIACHDSVVASLKDELSSAHNELSAAVLSRQHLETDLETKQCELNSVNEKFTSVNDELQAVKIKLCDTTTFVDQLSSESSTRSDDVAKLEEELELKKTEIQSLISQLDSCREEKDCYVEKIQLELAQTRVEMYEKSQEVSLLDAEKSGLLEQSSQSEKEVESLNTAIKALDNELEVLTNEKAGIQERLQAMNEELSLIKDENSQLSNLLQTNEEERERFKSDIVERESKIQQLALDVENASTQLEQATNRWQHLEEENENMKNELINLHRDLEEKMTRIHDLEIATGDKNEIALKLDEYQSQECRLKEEITQLQKLSTENVQFLNDRDTKCAELEKLLEVQTTKYETLAANSSDKYCQEKEEMKTAFLSQIESLQGDLEAEKQRFADFQTNVKQKFDDREEKFKEGVAKLKEKWNEKFSVKEKNLLQKIICNEENERKLKNTVSELEKSKEKCEENLSNLQKELHVARLTSETILEKERKITSMEENLCDNQKLVADMMSECDSLRGQLTKSLHEKESVISDFEREKHIIMDLENKLLSTVDKMAFVEERIAEKDSMLENLVHELQRLKNENEENVTLSKTMKEQVNSLMTELSVVTSEREEYVEKLRVTELNVQELLTEKTELDIVCSNLKSLQNSANESLVAEIAQSKTSLEEMDVKFNDLQNQFNKLSQENADKMEIISGYELKITELESCDVLLQEQLKELTDNLSSADVKLQDSITNYESCIEVHKTAREETEARLKHEDERHSEEVASLRRQMNDLENSQKMSAEQLHDTLQIKVREYEEKILEMSESHRLSLEDRDDLNKKKETELKQKLVAKLKEVNARHEERMKEMKSSLSNMQEENRELQSKIDALSVDGERIEMLIKEKEELMRNSEESRSELISLRELCDRLRAEADVSASRCSELQTTIYSLEETKRSLEADFNSELEQIRTTCNQKNDEILDLKQLLDVQRQELNFEVEKVQNTAAEIDKTSSFESEILDLKNRIEKIQSSHSKQIEDIELKHQTEIQHLKVESKEKMKRIADEGNQKLAELKKKAEMKLSQIKKQFENNKESARDGTDSMLDRIRAENSELEEKLQTALTENQRIQTEIDVLRREKEEEMNSCKEKSSDINIPENEGDSQGNKLSKYKDLIRNLKIEKAEQNQALNSLEKDKKSLQEKLDDLTSDLKRLREKYSVLEGELDVEIRTLKMEHEKEIANLKQSNAEKLEEMADLSNSKVKHLLKECNLKMAEKEKEYAQQLDSSTSKVAVQVAKNNSEHIEQIDDLIKDLHEKDDAMEELKNDYEELLKGKNDELRRLLEQCQRLVQEKEAAIAGVTDQMNGEIHRLETILAHQQLEHQREINELQLKVDETVRSKMQTRESIHREEVDGLVREFEHERKHCNDAAVLYTADAYLEELVRQNHLALNAIRSGSSSGELMRQQIVQLTKELDELRSRHRLESADLQTKRVMMSGSLARPLLALRSMDRSTEEGQDLDDVQQLELDNMDLQANVMQLNAEVAQHRNRERDLLLKLDWLESRLHAYENGQSPPPSPHGNHSGSHGNHADLTPSGPLLTAVTEYEYLRNILYQYMLGRETRTLSRVVCTVMKFSQEQIARVIEYEELKAHQWLTTLA